MKTQELKENLTRLQGVPVVAFEEGLRLGKVHDIFIDKSAKRVQGISFMAGLWDRENESYVDLTDILKIGKDVIIVSRKTVATPLSDTLAGSSLRHLRGFKITTHDGACLGEVADLNVNRENGAITEIILTDRRMLEVDVGEIVLGPDVIVVPAAYAERITRLAPERMGLLERMVGPAAVTDSLRDKYEEIKAMVSSGKGAEKMFETLRSGSEMTRKTVRRTSRIIQETVEQMRQKREPRAGAEKEEEEGYQGAEAEHAGRTYAGKDSDEGPPPSYQEPHSENAVDPLRTAAPEEPRE